MSRDKIKIVEFGLDDAPPAGSKPDDARAMKILEFDSDDRDERPTVATGKDVGPIKIVEFDDDLSSPQKKANGPPQAARRPINIKEFDQEKERTVAPGGGPKMKIVEFD